MPTTMENLATAFAGESQANRKYLAFAKKAEQEGFPQIARVFRAAADAETIHAHGHLNSMGGVGSTLENVQAAVKGETYEFTEMYPPMLAQAEKEKHKSKVMFGFANKAEKVHAGMFGQALEALKSGADLSQMDVYLCPFCGDIEFGKVPDKCPICGTPAAKFQKVA
ncbi:MAG: rubrerythrin family protein [Myxococcaceae bacterium]